MEPDNAEAWNRQGSLAAAAGNWDNACRAYHRAAGLAPGEPSHWEGLAFAALSAQRLNVAKQARDQLLERFPRRAISHLVAGHIHKALGEDDGAVAAYEAALALCPHLSEAIYNLVDLRVPAPGHPLSRQAVLLARREGAKEADKANLRFATGRIFEAAGDYDAAFVEYQAANEAASRAMAERGVTYTRKDSENFTNDAIDSYPAGTFVHAVEPLPIDLRLIFIVGMPRSGTTLIEQILSSHPRVAPGGELPVAGDCAQIYARRRTELGLRGPVDPTNERERSLIADVREIYIDRLFERGLDANYVTDKQPGNFARLGFIRQLFPDAIIVHCKRHPIATCWSLFTANFANHSPYYNSLEHLAHYHRCYQKIMSHWGSVSGAPIIDVQYEEIVSRPDEQVRRLVDAVGLDWDRRCLDFHTNPRPVLTASYRSVRTPMYTSSVDRWRRFQSHLGALRDLAQVKEHATARSDARPTTDA